jgi:hypothetical protein
MLPVLPNAVHSSTKPASNRIRLPLPKHKWLLSHPAYLRRHLSRQIEEPGSTNHTHLAPGNGTWRLNICLKSVLNCVHTSHLDKKTHTPHLTAFWACHLGRQRRLHVWQWRTVPSSHHLAPQLPPPHGATLRPLQPQLTRYLQRTIITQRHGAHQALQWLQNPIAKLIPNQTTQPNVGWDDTRPTSYVMDTTLFVQLGAQHEA